MGQPGSNFPFSRSSISFGFGGVEFFFFKKNILGVAIDSLNGNEIGRYIDESQLAYRLVLLAMQATSSPAARAALNLSAS